MIITNLWEWVINIFVLGVSTLIWMAAVFCLLMLISVVKRTLKGEL
tara:strand:- start:4399 stop:4536 length:138 start_codon:yes stop_codon:yes gene_type:complete